MKLTKEIWYLEKSPAARLAGGLKGEWTRRALTAKELSHPRLKKGPPRGETAVVCLVDLRKDDYEALLRSASHYPAMKAIGLAGGGAEADKAPDGEFFTVLPRTATRTYVARAVNAAFQNIELAARDLESRGELALAESEMDELNQIGVAL